MLNVHTGRIGLADVAIAGLRIAAVGDVEHTIGPVTEIVDCTGMYLLPGFIDSHIHLGGSQLTVQRLAEVLVPHGTVALCTDFYELGTIGGSQRCSTSWMRPRGSGLDILLSPFIAAVLGIGPSATSERFSYDDIETLLNHAACVELREWNCWAGLAAARGPAAGLRHRAAPGQDYGGHLEGSRAKLQASIALGVMSEHEAVSTDEAMERIEHGVMVQIRGGSAARDFDDLVPAITERGADPSQFSFCTDEQELSSMAHDGHIDRLLRRAVRSGISPVDAVRMATLNAAKGIGVEKDYGSITPGRFASIVCASTNWPPSPSAWFSPMASSRRKTGNTCLTPEPVEYSR